MAMQTAGCAPGGEGSDAGSDAATQADAGDAGSIDASVDAGPDVGLSTRVSGNIFNFSSSGGWVNGATVEVLDFPHIKTQSDSNGHFELDVVRGTTFILRMQYPGFVENITGTHVAADEKMEEVNFQAPDITMFEMLAKLAEVVPDPKKCQIATTVNPKGEPAHGEPDATVTIEPPLPKRYGPIYFEYISDRVIYPDRSLLKTSRDGGVLFLNVPPGEYTMTAHKEGMEFTQARVKCIAGLLVNAAPPRGLMVK
jgi:hypothetical protein